MSDHDETDRMTPEQFRKFTKLSNDQYAEIIGTGEQTPEMAARFAEQHKQLREERERENQGQATITAPSTEQRHEGEEAKPGTHEPVEQEELDAAPNIEDVSEQQKGEDLEQGSPDASPGEQPAEEELLEEAPAQEEITAEEDLVQENEATTTEETQAPEQGEGHDEEHRR